MEKLIYCISKVGEFMEDRGLSPEFYLLCNDEHGQLEETLLDTTDVLADPCTGLLYLAHQINYLESRTLTSLHRTYAIVSDPSAIFRCRFTITRPESFSNVVFTHYAYYILTKTLRESPKILINDYIPEVVS